MNKNNSQVVNTLLIVIGGGLLIFELAGDGKENVYLLILGIVLLMFGLYRATNFWVYTKDDHKDEKNDTENPNSKKDE